MKSYVLNNPKFGLKKTPPQKDLTGEKNGRTTGWMDPSPRTDRYTTDVAYRTDQQDCGIHIFMIKCLIHVDHKINVRNVEPGGQLGPGP